MQEIEEADSRYRDRSGGGESVKAGRRSAELSDQSFASLLELCGVPRAADLVAGRARYFGDHRAGWQTRVRDDEMHVPIALKLPADRNCMDHVGCQLDWGHTRIRRSFRCRPQAPH